MNSHDDQRLPLATIRRMIAPIRRLAAGDVDGCCRRLRSDRFDWNAFRDFLRQHNLREFFGSFAERDPIGPLVPERLRNRFVGLSWSVRRQEQLRKLRIEACDLFEAHELPVLVLKGEPLEARFYSRGMARHQGDVDLLVRRADVSRALFLLQKLSLTRRGTRAAISAGQLIHSHAIGLKRDDVALDLHWKFRAGPDYSFDEELVWATRQRVALDGGDVETLSDESLLVLMCLSLAHDLGRGGVRLKSLIDLWFVMRRAAPDGLPARFWRRCEREGIAAPCRHSLAIAERILPGLVPAADQSAFITREERSAIDRSRGQAWRLIARPRDSAHSWLWFARLQKLWKPPHALWMLRQSIPHPGRIPVAAVRSGRFVRQLLVRMFVSERRELHRLYRHSKHDAAVLGHSPVSFLAPPVSSCAQTPRKNRFLTRLRFAGLARNCPCCRSRLRRFVPCVAVHRPEAQCPVCGALERHRLIRLYLERRTDLDDGRPKTVLHIAPDPELAQWIRRLPGVSHITIEPAAEQAQPAMELTLRQFCDGAFDVVYCSQVLERVQDDQLAMREMHRVLKPGGWAILDARITAQATTDIAQATTSVERVGQLGQHGFRRRYGQDFATRLEQAGFLVTIDAFARQLPSATVRRHGLLRSQLIHVCGKSSSLRDSK